jgi:hypothetical protein
MPREAHRISQRATQCNGFVLCGERQYSGYTGSWHGPAGLEWLVRILGGLACGAGVVERPRMEVPDLRG